ncbi:hypothetical protein PHYPSEUDO_009237 [Phytophthora pseudosyringae]|uniref:WRKY19-like zinc finger domain-containing protein n=1 Tax=Phytophthora pseudosyringae TaxID=221518 RepID=A0A8T1VD51_9STRA|nr:hypothetical protein PHYPSEUDO_009237 [Phytophthora pseudosyringae]
MPATATRRKVPGCSVPGCIKQAQTRKLCKAHGGGMRCRSPNCTKLVQSRGLCVAHGGGRRCVFDGCSKLAQYKGLCFSHGGSRYCSAPGCHKYAQIRACCKSHANLLGPPESTCSVAKLQASPAHASPPPTSNGFKNAMGDVAHPVLPHILYRGDSQASAPRVASCDKILPHLASRFVIPKRPATDLDTLKTFSTKESTALELFRPYCRRLYCQPRLMQGNL